MGKYDSDASKAVDHHEPTTVTDSFFLFKIANELAEANRLKRLEMKAWHFQKDKSTISNEDLEDKA